MALALLAALDDEAEAAELVTRLLVDTDVVAEVEADAEALAPAVPDRPSPSPMPAMKACRSVASWLKAPFKALAEVNGLAEDTLDELVVDDDRLDELVIDDDRLVEAETEIDVEAEVLAFRSAVSV